MDCARDTVERAACASARPEHRPEVWRRIWQGETEVPWHATLLTLLALLAFAGAAAALSTNYHVFGTDKVGQDVFYQALKSIRTGLVIGTLTTLVMLPFAHRMLGIMAGYFGGWVDDVIQYVYTTLNSIPGVLLIAAAVLMMQVYIDTHPDLFETVGGARRRCGWCSCASSWASPAGPASAACCVARR